MITNLLPSYSIGFLKFLKAQLFNTISKGNFDESGKMKLKGVPNFSFLH